MRVPLNETSRFRGRVSGTDWPGAPVVVVVVIDALRGDQVDE